MNAGADDIKLRNIAIFFKKIIVYHISLSPRVILDPTGQITSDYLEIKLYENNAKDPRLEDCKML